MNNRETLLWQTFKYLQFELKVTDNIKSKISWQALNKARKKALLKIGM